MLKVKFKVEKKLLATLLAFVTTCNNNGVINNLFDKTISFNVQNLSLIIVSSIRTVAPLTAVTEQ